MRLAGTLVERLEADGSEPGEATVLGSAHEEAGEEPDEDTTELVRAFLPGAPTSSHRRMPP
jgi:hypothetical protein